MTASATRLVAPGVEVVRDLWIPMRDGCRLAADLYRPTGQAEPLPAVVDYIPYRKDEVDPTSAAVRHYLELPRHGYVVVRVDIRGTGASEGVAFDEYPRQEQEDGYDAVEWIAAQPWCDGHVNLMGISYGGFTALQVAALRPPHLASIVPVDATDDRYTDDCHYRGGLLGMYYDVAWYGTRMIAWNAMPPADAVEVAPVRVPAADVAAGAASAPDDRWREHLDRNEPYLLAWLRHQVDGPYWRQGSVAGSLEQIACPVFVIGGWRDGYPNPPPRLAEGLGVPRQMLVGPWDHAYPDAAIPGPRIDHLPAVVRWLDRWCRDESVAPDEPPVVVFVQEAGDLSPTRLDVPGSWRAERSWPPTGATTRTIRLGGDPGDRPADPVAVPYRPTAGVASGLWSGGVPFGLPDDQRADEGDAFVVTGPSLDADLTIIGRPRARLSLAVDVPVLGVRVRLCEVDGSGASHLVTAGRLNLTRRHSLTDPEPIVPGEPMDVTVDLDAVAWRFRAGNRIRVAVDAAEWPNAWPTPFPGTLTVNPAGSSLELPEVPAAGSAPSPTFAPSPVTVVPPAARRPAPTWTHERDHATGREAVTVGVTARFTSVAGESIERDWEGRCEVDPADPARAVARGRHRCRADRDGAWREAEARVVIAGSETTFEVTIDVEVRLHDGRHASRSWAESIPRVLL